MEKKNGFSSPELEQAANRVQSGLAAYQARLDAISADIKRLEAMFEESKFNVETWIQVDQRNTDLNEATGAVTAEAFELGWSDAGGGRFRLVYRHSTWGWDVDMPHLSDDREVDVLKPLIEMPVEVRLAMQPHLPNLVLAVGRQADPFLHRTLQEEEAKTVEIPF
jgi:hypothetical protein